MVTTDITMETYLEPIRAYLKGYTQLELKQVAAETGISSHTLQKLRTGAISNPTLATYHALKQHMEAHQQQQGDAA